jgi:hypothetical protein
MIGLMHYCTGSGLHREPEPRTPVLRYRGSEICLCRDSDLTIAVIECEQVGATNAATSFNWVNGASAYRHGIARRKL